MEDDRALYAARKEYFEEPMSSIYDNKIVGIPARMRIKYLLKECGELKNKTVLDVGCEAGHVSLLLKERGATVYSIDIVQEALDEFKNKDQKNDKIFLMHAERTLFTNNSFDIIIITEVLEHVINPEIVIKEMKRLLKPGGNIIITYPLENNRRRLYPLAKLLGVNTTVEPEVTIQDYDDKKMLELISKHLTIKRKYCFPKIYPLTRIVTSSHTPNGLVSNEKN